MSFRLRLLDAWRLLLCRGAVHLFQSDVIGEPPHIASSDHHQLSPLRTFRVLKCGRPEMECMDCPRFKAFRQIPQKFDADIFFFTGNGDVDFGDGDMKSAQIERLDADSTFPRTIHPPTRRDFETHAVLPKGMACVDHAKHRAEHGDGQGQVLHTAQPATEN